MAQTVSKKPIFIRKKYKNLNLYMVQFYNKNGFKEV
jgi:hypothetical protein